MINVNDSLVGALSEAGVSASPATIASLADCAMRVGVNPVVVQVLTDPTEPTCARVRAFGRVAARVYAQTNEVYGSVIDRGSLVLAA